MCVQNLQVACGLGPSPRQAKMAGLGSSKEAASALFDELSPGSPAKKVYEGDGGNYVVLQLSTRTEPNVSEFDKIADAEIARMQEARGKAAVHDWLAVSRHAPRIAAVRGAHPRHGGGGSLYIVLRRR